MKNIQKQITILIIGVALVITSCTSGFEDDNTNKAAISIEQQEIDNKIFAIPLNILQVGIYIQYSGIGLNWPWQVTQNLTSDIYSGYLHPVTGSWFSSHPSYAYNDAWNLSYQYTYQTIAPAILQSEIVNVEKPDFLSVTKILKVELLHRMTDLYGPILYSQYGINPEPDSQEAAYKAMFKDLDDAIVMLEAWITANPGANPFVQDILTTDKTYESWLKFANSLRLRLAMRVSFIDKELAKENIDKALAYKKFLEIGATDYIAVKGGAYTNPLATIISWNNIATNANMEMYMNGYKDPRISKYFNMASDPAAIVDPKPTDVIALFPVKGTLKGVPQSVGKTVIENGSEIVVGVTDDRYKYSATPAIYSDSPAFLMTAAEIWLLRSEAALRGLSSENAEECYKKGVQASFDQWNAGDATAYLESEETPAPYTDQFDAEFDYALKTTITPKWGGSQAENFERIAVQKWISVFPEGDEGWAEQRRMGYPELMKVRNNQSGGVISSEIGIRRLPYPISYVVEGQAPFYVKLQSHLAGPDNGATRLWWDVENKVL